MPLSPRRSASTSTAMDPLEIFDRNARRLRRKRAAHDFAAHDFLHHFMAETIADRLAGVKRHFRDVLVLGGPGAEKLPLGGMTVTYCGSAAGFSPDIAQVIAEEDRLPFAPASFDLVLSLGVLDTVNDLPGALLLIRRALRPDGLLLAAFTGGTTLATLRAVLLEAEADRPAARIHPMVDVRSAGDLLLRAGFALPVADSDILTVRYGHLLTLLADLRGMGAANVMAGRTALRRDTLRRAVDLFAARADSDGKVAERFEIIVMTGWAPGPDQPQPARRGSAVASLAAALARNS